MRNQMSNYLWTFLAVIVLILVFSALWCFNKRTRYFHDLATCEELLRTSNLTKRAAPNERLKIAFGIENSFTTTDKDYHDKFQHSIKQKLHDNDGKEARINVAVEATQNIRHMLDGEKDVSLEKLVKNVVFRTVLSILFPQIPQPTNNDLDLLTHTIDPLWYDSKSPLKIWIAKVLPNHSTIIQNRKTLHLQLKRLFSNPPLTKDVNAKELFLNATTITCEITDRSNPLNTLLPAYIGLWKVVLKAFIEVRFRNTPSERTEYTSLILQFIRSPTDDIWYKTNDSGISAQSIIAETLRLYPPTRRIYTLGSDGITRAVDIERLHRKKGVWGKDPDKFDPHRWTKLDVVKTKEYMPFGAKSSNSISRCPSRRRGGPKLCAVLLGALLQEIGEQWELENGDRKASRSLGSGRDTFKKLRLMKTSPTHSIGQQGQGVGTA